MRSSIIVCGWFNLALSPDIIGTNTPYKCYVEFMRDICFVNDQLSCFDVYSISNSRLSPFIT